MSATSRYLRLLEDYTASSLAACCAEDWRMLYASPALLRLYPQPAPEAASESFFHYLRGNGFAEVGEPLEEGLEGATFVRHTLGDVYAVHWMLAPDPEDDARRLRLVRLYKTPLEPAHHLLNLHLQELNVLIDSIQDGIWVIDSDGITLRINKAMERIAGIRAEEVVGRHVNEPVKWGMFRHSVTLRAMEERGMVSMFDDYANGKRCLNTSIPIFDGNGNIWRVIASIRDITELESLQSKLILLEQETLAYKTRLLSMEQQSDAGFVGHSQAIRDLRGAIYKAGRTSAATLIQGATGTGKTRAAKAIHDCGPRAGGPFICVNCGSIPESLIESELFGYDSGAFTGASKGGKKGMFELAHSGTLLLDEIGEMPLSMQAKLLQVLDDQVFYRVGGTRRVRVDVHILAATNKDLTEMTAAGAFREDLYYRLRVVAIHIPPLRERPGDIAGLAMYFLENHNSKTGEAKRFSSSIIPYFLAYAWPGNVRELQSVVRVLASMGDTDLITEADLPPYVRSSGPTGLPGLHTSQSLREALDAVEKSMLETALHECGSTYKAARRLKISQSSVVRKARRHRVDAVENVRGVGSQIAPPSVPKRKRGGKP